ncbi:hypothetical protein BD410DRAFT_783500 [Rickenella mellea]|uniref:Roadblock/LAMTOR2 domain-containing protein n=1 Tax=Rickenella mellea TaxID=50990 RepID=A0A4Y7QFL7_9AGAM|nr:hypothetical protein BD410DRAFT_783500 [Rickenella mellea]
MKVGTEKYIRDMSNSVSLKSLKSNVLLSNNIPHVDMLVLASLNKLLSQILSPPDIHSVVLLTPAGSLVSFVTSHARSKDDIRMLAGLSGEIWAETRGEGVGMVESELGRVVVVPVQPVPPERAPEPFMLIVVNATENVDWGELQMKARGLADHLTRPLREVEDEYEGSARTVPRISR